MRRPVSSYLAAVVLLALAAFAVRAVSLDSQSLWRDEVDALRFATVPWAEMLSSFTRHGWNGPLYYLLLRGWVALAGTSEYAMRFFSLTFGVLCVPLVYVLGRRLLNRQTGLIAALLVTASPYLTWYAQEVKMYTLVPALTILAIYGLRHAVEGDGWPWWAAQIVATSMAFYCHILAALLIPVQVLIYFSWWPQARRRWVGALASLACLTLPYLPLADWQVPMTFESRETGFIPYTLGNMVEVLLNGWGTGIFGSTGWGWPWGMILMGVLAVWGLLSPLTPPLRPSPSPRKQGEGEGLGVGMRGRLALLCWLVIPLLAVWLVSLRQPIFTDRYLVWSAPAFYLLIAAGLAFFLRFGGWGRLVVAYLAGLMIISNGVNLWRQAAVPIKSDFRAAAAYVANYQPPDEPATVVPQALDETTEAHVFRNYLPLVMTSRSAFEGLIVFQIPYGRYTFDYYFPVDGYPWAEGPYTNHRGPDGSYLMSEREAAYRMETMTARYDVVWLVVTEMEMWDQRGLAQAWLDTNARRTDEAHFMRVDVYRYVR
jgi:4-amino-4-deoxy-L-arabinose transferase-like glycosyltransferase